MLYLLLLPLLVMGAVLVFLALQPGEVSVRRSMVIRCAPEQAFDLVRNLRSWPEWSPWPLHEPDAEVSFSEDPGAARGWFAWDGRLIGAGRIRHVALHAPERIEQRVEFTRPFKSTAAMSWEFEATAQDAAPATRVYWVMRGRMPFLMRFMATTMSGLVGKDYELGLARLHAQLDPAAPRLALRFRGLVELPAQTAWVIAGVGGRTDGSDGADTKQAMMHGLQRLAQAAHASGVTPAGPPFSACHTPEPKATRLRCDLALPVPAGTGPAGFEVKELAGGPWLVTELQGSYAFLELAWHAAMGQLRLTKRQWDRSRPALEVYATGVDQAADDNDLLTRICLPVKPTP
jgi:DNA gyrase inhibitor GyrI